MAHIVKPGHLRPTVFRGRCPACGAVIEADRAELVCETCPREGYEFSHFACLQCNGRMVLYPRKDKSI
jgi:hypothetical protein